MYTIPSLSPPHPPLTTTTTDLEPAELVNLSIVSRQLLGLSRDNNLWKTHCFTHSIAERRRRRIEATSDIDPRLAELITAANNIANVLDTNGHDAHASSAENTRETKWEALRTKWDPSYPGEKVNWYQDFIQRHAPQQLSFFQDAGNEGRDEDEVRREATGAGILFDDEGLAHRLIAPMDDGSICIWDASAQSERMGKMISKTNIGLLSNRGSDLDYDTRLSQSQAIMTETGAVECVSIDDKLQKGFFAVQNVLNEVDINTLQVVSRTPYPFPITALSEAHHTSPLTVGTNWTLHLHDFRKPPAPAPPSSTRCELISGPSNSLETATLGNHVSLSQPGALSILHLPDDTIWVAGRFTSLLNFDRRFFPRLRGTVHSGARLSCLSSLPYPAPSHTLLAAGSYKGKGSLELYNLSSDPTYPTSRNSQAGYQNRQTASSSKLLAVAPHGTRVVFSDGDGNIKWVERDCATPVRHFNINDLQRRVQHVAPQMSNPLQADMETGWGDIVQKIIPTTRHVSNSSHNDDLVVWTGDGKLGTVSFGAEPLFDGDFFEDAVEVQGVKVREREREYGVEMRRALEMQAREVRWLRGYGL